MSIKQNSFLYLLLAAILYFVFFQHLGSFFICSWDESMFAVNAYEMSNNHNFMVPFYKNAPDLWNSKPPLQLWFQVLFIKLIGYNETAIRLPSAIAGSLSALLLFSFIKKRISLLMALCTFMVFVTSFGVSTFHTARTGDSDALLLLLTLCACLSFYKWLFEEKAIALFYVFVFLSLAFLTKSIAGLLFIPAFFISVTWFKKWGMLFKSKWFYAGTILFLIISAGYFGMRETGQKGYIDYFIDNDLGRVSTVIESHNEPFDFYLNNLFYERFWWILLVLPGMLLCWLNKELKPVAIYGTLIITTYFLIISSSVTKLEWYDLPLFPALSLFSAYVIYVLIEKININQSVKTNILALCVIFIMPLYYTFRNSYKSEIPYQERKLEVLTEYAFKNRDNESLNGVVFCSTYFDRPLYFYKYRLNSRKQDFGIVNSVNELRPGNIVVVSEDTLKQQIALKYHTEILERYHAAHKMRLGSLK